MTRRIGGGVAGASWLAGFLVLVSGCAGPLEPSTSTEADPPVAPAAARTVDPEPGPSGPEGAFYPLELGNHWTYSRRFQIQFVPENGVPETVYDLQAEVDIDLIGIEQRHGRDYVVQLETMRAGGQVSTAGFLYRQDRGGLYTANPGSATDLELVGRRGPADRFSHRAKVLASLDVAGASAKRAWSRGVLALLDRHQLACDAAMRSGLDGARPGPLDGEIALLRYPLHSRRTWRLREEPLIFYTVEGQESLELPAGRFQGWRIRVDWPPVPDIVDHVHVWRGRSGLLRIRVHSEGPITDENGNPLGRAMVDENMQLVDLDLVDS